MDKPHTIHFLLKILFITILLAGCTANGLAIRYFYGKIDNELYERILTYATFTKAQKEQIRESVEKYSNWHKTIELPRYVVFLSQLATQIETGKFSTDIILADFKKIRGFANTSFIHSPLYDSAKFLKTLSDQQITEIKNSFEKQDLSFGNGTKSVNRKIAIMSGLKKL